MKLGHTAAFVLAGWFLLTPPKICEDPKTHGPFDINGCLPDPSAPINKWVTIQAFDSQDACERQLNTLVGAQFHADDQCVYEGDPRLVK